MELKTKAITNFILSRWSCVWAACFKYYGAKVHKSAILWIEDLASKILIGNEICDIPLPESASDIAYLATLDKIPFCLFKASSLVHISPPWSGFEKFFKIEGSSQGMFNSKFYRMKSGVKYLGGGATELNGWRSSMKE